MKLTIDGVEVEVKEGATLLEAAKRAGIEVPTLCHREGYAPFTSCMICVVRDKASGRTLPACSAPAGEGMEIETQSAEIRQNRKSTLELLLSEHVGDCEAPCQRVCPIHMEIPRMIRAVLGKDLKEAITTVRRDMAIPSILERYCHAPCEKGCRRVKADEGLSIRQLTRYVADRDLERGEPYVPPVLPATGKKVAIIGAGVTGLSVSHYLAMKGHACVVYERRDRVGGRVETEFARGPIPDWVLAGELKVLNRLGVKLRMRVEVGREVALAELGEGFDAVVVACGETAPEALKALGLPVTEKGLKVSISTSMTAVGGVFAGGSVIRPGQPLIKSAVAAKSIAACVDQYLGGRPVVGIEEMYNHTMGRLLEGEIETFLREANPIPRLAPDDLEEAGFERADAELEGTRCMHCDCRGKDHCKLRIYSDEYGAGQGQFAGEQRAAHVHINQNAGAVYDPGKCVKCGLCVRVTKREGEHFGFTFVGRGFDLKAGVSLDKPLNQGLELDQVAKKVCDACPTGALEINEKQEQAE